MLATKTAENTAGLHACTARPCSHTSLESHGVSCLKVYTLFGIFIKNDFLLWLQHHKEPSEAGCGVVSMGVQSFLKSRHGHLRYLPGFHFLPVPPGSSGPARRRGRNTALHILQHEAAAHLPAQVRQFIVGYLTL